MGSSESKNPQYTSALELFSPEEQNQITQLYSTISDNNKDGFSEADLQKYGQPWLVEPLMARLFHYMKSLIKHEPGDHTNDLLVTGEEFAVSLAPIVKGSPEERSNFVIFLTTGNFKGPVATSSLAQFLGSLFESFKKCQADSELLSWKLASDTHLETLSKFVLHDLIYKGQKRQCDITADFPWQSSHGPAAVEKWLSSSAVILNLLEAVVHKVFPLSVVDTMIHKTHLIPKCENTPWNKFNTLLDLPSLIFINQHLPRQVNTRWQLLFSTSLHGESFATMMKNITDKGPTVLVIQDMDGYVFGGYASTPWNLTSQFIGSPSSFLYSLSPVMDVYQTTGYNDNFLYVNHAQETIPNGLGMGGQFDYFGLWLDYEFGQGHSKAEPRCTTYGSPQLSANQDFTIRKMEVWAVGPEPTKQDGDEMGKGSILDKDPAAQAMLTLLDKGPLSDGLREEDPMADIPGDHTL